MAVFIFEAASRRRRGRIISGYRDFPVYYFVTHLHYLFYELSKNSEYQRFIIFNELLVLIIMSIFLYTYNI